MESTGPKVRFVRCPKCAHIIAEFADIPIYRCGSCNTVLRAKYSSQNLSDISSFNNGSKSSGKEVIASSSEVEQAPNGAVTCDEKGESSELGERDPDHENPRPTISLALESEVNLNEEVEKSPKLSPQDHDSSRPTDKEDMGDRGFGEVRASSLRSNTSGSRAYDGGVSSSDDSEHTPRKYSLSKRTRRHKKVLDSIDDKGKKAGEDDLAAADAGSLLQVRNLTFGSEDFHSVRNWMEPEDEAPSRSRSRELIARGDSLNRENDYQSPKLRYLKSNQMKILKKVDELRDELAELFGQTVEAKIRALLRSIREEDLTRDPDSNHRRQRKITAQRFQSSHSPPPNICHESQALECESEKLGSKEKKQTIKRHCRPIAGGAPFVVCCECLKLLQVPADFLVSRRSFHKLQCGACSKILLYSFRARGPTIPHTPIEARHPPSEIEHSTDSDTGHERTPSHSNDRARGDLLSYSEEHGFSFAISDSSEAEPVLNVSRNSLDQREEQNGTQVNASRLHRLLGYDSASELLRRSRNVDEGYQSTEPSTPRFFRPEGGEMRYELKVTGIRTPRQVNLEAGTSSNFVGRLEEDESLKRSMARRREVSPLRGFLKRGLETVKLKIHSNGKVIPNPYAKNLNQ